MGLILALIVGGIAGSVADRLMGSDNPLVLNIVLGVVGAFLFNIIMGLILGLSGGNLLADLLSGVAGACVLIWGYRVYKGRN